MINDERARREIKLLDHPRLKDRATTNRPTFGSILGLIMAGPTPPPQLIDASEACNHLRKHLRVRGTVTDIEANRRGDVILRFESAHKVFKAVIPASCVLSKEEEWIKSEKSNAYSKRPHKLLCAGASHADPGKKSGSFAGRLKANLKTIHGEVLSKASHAHRRSSLSTRNAA